MQCGQEALALALEKLQQESVFLSDNYDKAMKADASLAAEEEQASKAFAEASFQLHLSTEAVNEAKREYGQWIQVTHGTGATVLLCLQPCFLAAEPLRIFSARHGPSAYHMMQ